MTLRLAIAMAWHGLRANGLRSLLTMLGIMIGVAAVILLVALGNGTSARLNSQLEALGTNLIGVFQAGAACQRAVRANPSRTGTSRRCATQARLPGSSR